MTINDKPENKKIQKSLKQLFADNGIKLERSSLILSESEIQDLHREGSAANEKVEAEYLRKIKEEDLIENYDLGAELMQVDQDAIIELSEKALSIYVDPKDMNVKYKHNNEVLNLDFSFDDVKHREDIASLLPPVEIDIVQSGIKERQLEVEAIYKVVTINKIYGGIYNSEIYNIISNYDFDEIQNNDQNFFDLLRFISQSASPVMRIIISACNIAISKARSKKEAQIYSTLSEAENRGLAEVRFAIYKTRHKFDEMSKEAQTRGQKLVISEQQAKAIEEVLNDEKYGMLHKILKLNVENLKDFTRQRLALQARKLVGELKLQTEGKVSEAFFRDLESKLMRRGVREYLAEVKIKLIKEWRETGKVNLDSF